MGMSRCASLSVIGTEALGPLRFWSCRACERSVTSREGVCVLINQMVVISLTVATVMEDATQGGCASFSDTRNCNRLQAFVCGLEQDQPPSSPHPLAAMGARTLLLSFWVCAILPRQELCSQETLPHPWDLSIQSNTGNLGP